MTELRLPADLELRLHQEAEALDLTPGDFVQLLLNSWQILLKSPQTQISPEFTQLLEQAEAAHAPLLAKQELWA
ncbi:MAG TPA: hypothetical protein V6D23_15605 [Candidatus Obscuribacterales bacterium]